MLNTLLNNGYVLTVCCIICIGGFAYSCRRIAYRRQEPDWMYWFWHALGILNVIVLSYFLWRATSL